MDTSLTDDEQQSWAKGLFDGSEITVYSAADPVDRFINPATELWLVPYDADAWSALMGVVEAGGDPATSRITFTATRTPESAPINQTTMLAR